jgi:hypothetical protein
MMNDPRCTYDGRRDEVLVGYLYNDIDVSARDAFERHLSGCAPCRAELAELGDIRDGLADWTPPAVDAGVGGTTPLQALRLAAPPPARGWRAIGDAPLWAQAAAAMLVVGASLGLANINLTYSHDGLSVTTGWSRPASVAPATTASVQAQMQPPWRADLTALDQQLRHDLTVPPPATPVSTTATDEALLKRVRVLLQESEKRQQSELALRVAEVARDAQSQRLADLVKIDRSLGLIQNRTGVEVMRTQQQLNTLAQRVSQQK